MKVLVIAFESGVQWQLFFDGEVPEFAQTPPSRMTISDDYGQTVSFSAEPMPAMLIQDTDGTDRAQIAAMIRNAKNQGAAQAQFQSDPRNMIMRPPAMMP